MKLAPQEPNFCLGKLLIALRFRKVIHRKPLLLARLGKHPRVHEAVLAGMVSIGAISKPDPAWAARSCCMYKCGALSASIHSALRKTFVERIEDLAPAKQRRTVGFHVASNAIAQALGGSAGAN
jgi:hypothetical protein